MALALKEDSLKWALNHALSQGDTDIFPRAFEFDAVAENWDTVRKVLLSDLDTYAVRVPLPATTPKNRYGFRKCIQLDPLDFLVFTALVYESGNDLERVRVPASDGIVHSYRFKTTTKGRMYDPDYGFDSFTSTSSKLSERYKYVVIADVADFYANIYHHRLKQSIEAAGLPNHARVLEKLVGQWRAGVSYGLPVGSDAARLLSEVTINDLDHVLRDKGVAFVRFSDDYRIFVNEKHEGLKFLQSWLICCSNATIWRSRRAKLGSTRLKYFVSDTYMWMTVCTRIHFQRHSKTSLLREGSNTRTTRSIGTT